MADQTDFDGPKSLMDAIRDFLGTDPEKLQTNDDVFKCWLDRAFSVWYRDRNAIAFGPFNAHFSARQDFPAGFLEFYRSEIERVKIGPSMARDLVLRKIEQLLDHCIENLPHSMEPHGLHNSQRLYDRRLAGKDQDYIEEFLFDLFEILLGIGQTEAYDWAARAIKAPGGLGKRKTRNETPAPIALYLRLNQFSTASEAKPVFFRALFDWARENTWNPAVVPHLGQLLAWRLYSIHGVDMAGQTLDALTAASTGQEIAPSVFLTLEDIEPTADTPQELERAIEKSRRKVGKIASQLRRSIDASTFIELERIVGAMTDNQKEDFRKSSVLLTMFGPQLEFSASGSSPEFDPQSDGSMLAKIEQAA